ncbi:hypothetical protein V9T40_014433 [Parthenolecanium corni]|uniref:Uncharacterized protein n=1 Tax=Parthenolecanium corni TaxID=536013 RepID=A0AAN9XYF1_9HEMI
MCVYLPLNVRSALGGFHRNLAGKIVVRRKGLREFVSDVSRVSERASERAREWVVTYDASSPCVQSLVVVVCVRWSMCLSPYQLSRSRSCCVFTRHSRKRSVLSLCVHFTRLDVSPGVCVLIYARWLVPWLSRPGSRVTIFRCHLAPGKFVEEPIRGATCGSNSRPSAEQPYGGLVSVTGCPAFAIIGGGPAMESIGSVIVAADSSELAHALLEYASCPPSLTISWLVFCSANHD